MRKGAIQSRPFLRLVNNCRVPIKVKTFDAGTPQLVHEVVYDEYHGAVAIKADGTTEPPPQTPQSEMPHGYSFDVVSSEIIRPGGTFKFSAPTTHISKDWHIEVPFQFELPDTNCCQPRMQALFTFYEVPGKDKRAFKER